MGGLKMELVIMKDKQAVTTSLQVADNFEKEHRNVARDIESLKGDVLKFEQMFFEADIPDSYGRDRKAIEEWIKERSRA